MSGPRSGTDVPGEDQWTEARRLSGISEVSRLSRLYVRKADLQSKTWILNSLAARRSACRLRRGARTCGLALTQEGV
jgi:hypothetical protein